MSHRRATVAVDELEVFNLVADSPFVCAVFNGYTSLTNEVFLPIWLIFGGSSFRSNAAPAEFLIPSCSSDEARARAPGVSSHRRR